jgi:DNA repair exonuclease SbcCD ATPase subunit
VTIVVIILAAYLALCISLRWSGARLEQSAKEYQEAAEQFFEEANEQRAKAEELRRDAEEFGEMAAKLELWQQRFLATQNIVRRLANNPANGHPLQGLILEARAVLDLVDPRHEKSTPPGKESGA